MNEAPIFFYYEHRFIQSDRSFVLVYGTSLEHCTQKLCAALKGKPESYIIKMLTILPDSKNTTNEQTDGNKDG